MDASSLAIQIIPDLNIDDKYGAIIEEAQNRITAFTTNAIKGNRIGELFFLEKSKLTLESAAKILHAKGQLVTGFQFESRTDAADDNFRVYVRKVLDNKKAFKFYLTPAVQEIMLQLISLEDRRTVAIFSMLNSSLDVGYRILTTLYGNQLKRLEDRVADFLKTAVVSKLEKLAVAKGTDDSDLWDEESTKKPAALLAPGRGVSQDNILQVMADDSTFAELNQYVEHVKSRSDRIREKRLMLEQNPDIPREELYKQMVREDLSHLENCYARVHIYLKAFYKNKERRNPGQNKVLRLFFGGEIEKITGETGLLEDLLSLGQDPYFKNIARHSELDS